MFYTAMGHREDVWTNPIFQDILVGGLKWTLGEVEADLAPNLTQTAPGAYTNPPLPGTESSKEGKSQAVILLPDRPLYPVRSGTVACRIAHCSLKAFAIE